MPYARKHNLKAHLIRIFQCNLPLYRIQPPAHNKSPVRQHSALAVPPIHSVGGRMAKMTIFLGGFLVLTILIGVLATIPPA